MADGSNIKKFTATDIERYHKGLLSSKERNELEKAALEDPFLADALEGYATVEVNATDDISDLKKRLDERINKEKTVPIEKRSAKFFWLRVAAIVILVAGAGVLVYEFGFNKKSKNIAETKSTKQIEPVKDSKQSMNVLPQQKTDSSGNVETNKRDVVIENKSKPAIVQDRKITAGSIINKSDSVSITANSNFKNRNVISPDKSNSVSNGYASTITKEKEIKNNRPVITQQDQTKATEVPKLEEVVANKKIPDKDADRVKDKFDRQANGFYKVYQNSFTNRNNIFRGRVMDENNNPLPFANITNISDSVGTYADAKGNFNLVSPDSILNVQVRSVGFNNANTQLRNSANNNIVLQENKNADAIVLSHKKFNADSLRQSFVKVDEPEPNDGWGAYDIYLANNLKMPDEAISRQIKGEVEVSFDVDKSGQPINMKIDKSLCNECDKEALRVIKEGPKWKRKAKKGRATVTVSF